MGNSPQIVLASTSPYRRDLLNKLNIPFTQIDPLYQEMPEDGEEPASKASRLATGKAKAGAEQLQTDQPALIIGSDQVAVCEETVLSKPGGFDQALKQLSFCSGKWMTFHTAVSLVNEAGQEIRSFRDQYALKLRNLDMPAIEAYLRLEEPYDCAGSLKAESHGILLIEASEGLDINTLYGLPLIKLTTELMELEII